MRIRKVIRDIPAGAAEDAIDIDVILKADSSTIDTVTTNTDGIGTYEQDGNPGPLLMEATIGSQTKRYDTQAEPALGLLTPIDLTIALRALGTGYLPGYTDPQTTDGGMAVSPGTGLQVLVAEGAVLIDGSIYRCTSSTALTVAANATGSTRYDYVVVRLTREGDDEEGKCELVVKTGTSGVNDAGPEITSTVYEYGLARITVANGASSLTSGNILDVRYNLTFDQSPALRWPSGSNHPQAGDLFYINSSGILTRLPIGTESQILNVASGIPAWASSAAGVGAHTHTSFQPFDLYATRDITTDSAVTISSTATNGAVISGMTDTQALSAGVTYDIFVIGNVQLNAGSGGSVKAGITIAGSTSGNLWLPETTGTWQGTQTEGGERSVQVFGMARNVPGDQTLTVSMVGKRATANGSAATACFLGWVTPRGTGGVA